MYFFMKNIVDLLRPHSLALDGYLIFRIELTTGCQYIIAFSTSY